MNKIYYHYNSTIVKKLLKSNKIKRWVDMDMDLDIKIDPDLLQIRLRSLHRYPNPIQIHFKPIQIWSDWIWITWILDHIQSIAIPKGKSFTALLIDVDDILITGNDPVSIVDIKILA